MIDLEVGEGSNTYDLQVNAQYNQVNVEVDEHEVIDLQIIPSTFTYDIEVVNQTNIIDLTLQPISYVSQGGGGVGLRKETIALNGALYQLVEHNYGTPLIIEVINQDNYKVDGLIKVAPDNNSFEIFSNVPLFGNINLYY